MRPARYGTASLPDELVDQRQGTCTSCTARIEQFLLGRLDRHLEKLGLVPVCDRGPIVGAEFHFGGGNLPKNNQNIEYLSPPDDDFKGDFNEKFPEVRRWNSSFFLPLRYTHAKQDALDPLLAKQ